MDRLYTPWRMKYVTSTEPQREECVFCNHLRANPSHDRENYLVYRGQTAFTVMNLYPYNTGHLMVLPNEHVATLAETSPTTQFEIITLVTYFTGLLSTLMQPDGFNIGLNMGRVAGAGIDHHLHVHLVPRWSGDTNFMSVFGDTRVLPEALVDTYDKIMTWLKEQPPQIPSLA
ncbi:MAG: HIT domain-containing protein [Anaerolineae bacterium]|nr:HIT domain-containing protein [Anaerolineae bacterium]